MGETTTSSDSDLPQANGGGPFGATSRSVEDDAHPITVGILTTESRQSLLQQALTSVVQAAARYEGPIELIVASPDNASIEWILDDYPLPLTYVRTDGTAPAGRNKIVEASDTEWILFLDDDCVVPPDIFDAYIDALNTTDPDAVGAIYGMVKFHGPRSRAFDAYRFTPFIDPFQIAATRDEVEWGVTANALVSKTALMSIGNFNESNPAPVSGEDVDIGLRLRDAGFELLTAPQAAVQHTTETWDSLHGNLKRCFLYGQSEFWLVTEYPERRRPLFHAEGSLQTFVLVAVALIGGLLLPLSVCSWLAARASQWWAAGRPASFSAFLLGDGYKLANLVGYWSQAIRSPSSSKLGLSRFEFYQHQFLQGDIPEEEVAGQVDPGTQSATNEVFLPNEGATDD